MRFGFGREKSAFQPMRQKAVEQRDLAHSYVEHEAPVLSDDKKPWKFYRSDAKEYFSASDDGIEQYFPGTTEEIERRIAQVHEEGRTALAVDLFGAADASSLGADKTINLTLVRPGPDSESQTFVEGNGFETNTQIRLVNAVEGSGADLVVVTFVPGAGLPLEAGSAHSEKVPYHALQLISLFERMHKRLVPGGVIAIKLGDIGEIIGEKFASYLDGEGIPYEYNASFPHVFKITKQ